MSREDLLVQEIEQLKSGIKQVKNTISDLNARRRALSSQPVIRHGQGLAQALGNIIPQALRPQNVGHINHAAWQFYYTVDFDLSQTPDWPNLTSNTRQISSFQVSQEASFLMMGLTRHANDYTSAGDLGPLAIELRDRQSSRFFNDSPIPIQAIAQKGFVTYLPVPMLLMPNAVMEIQLTTTLDNGVSQNAEGGSTGKHQFTCWGYRVRVQDADKVLSSIFG